MIRFEYIALASGFLENEDALPVNALLSCREDHSTPIMQKSEYRILWSQPQLSSHQLFKPAINASLDQDRTRNTWDEVLELVTGLNMGPKIFPGILLLLLSLPFCVSLQPKDEDWYGILGIEPTAPDAAVKSAYRKWVRFKGSTWCTRYLIFFSHHVFLSWQNE